MLEPKCRLTIADKYYGGAPNIPQQQPLGQQIQDVAKNLPKLVESQFGLAGKFGPQFAQQDIDLSKKTAPQYAGLGLDISKQFAPQYQALNLEQMQRNIAGQPLLSSLNQQAQQGLNQQGKLTDQEAYQATQGSITPFAGRNNVFNQAEATSFLNRDALVRQRQQQAQQFGAQVQNLNLGQLAGLGGVVQPPNLAALGGPGASYAPMNAGLGATTGQSNQLLGLSNEIASANQNAAATASIAGANQQSGLIGGGIGLVGTVLGSALIAY